MITKPELENRFSYHPPRNDNDRLDHQLVKAYLKRAADVVNERVPDGREKSTAMTKIEEAMFWANAGLARARA